MRLIDADAFFEKFRAGGDLYSELLESEDMREILKDEKITPTVDAEPATHAHWDKSYCIGENNTKLQNGYKCSHCGHYVPDTSFGFYYCDNCGAKMDGDTDD